MRISWLFNIADPHTTTHFLGCYGLFFTFGLFLPDWAAFCCTNICGTIWEALDLLNEHYNWNSRYLDPRGADLSDLLTDVIGAGLAWLVVWRFGA